jgi:voltage-gated potassium channel
MKTSRRKIDSIEHAERNVTLRQLEEWIEMPMQILGLVWLILLVLELTRGLSPALSTISSIIWIVFIADFVLRLILAPDKSDYFKRNWIVAVSLFVPAVRVLRFARVFRFLRAARGLRLVRIISTVNRSMNGLRRAMGRRGFGYVLALSVVVVIAGAAGMFAFEKDIPGTQGFTDFPTALWWTAMMMTTLGSEFWPKSVEGRVLCFLLAVYAFAVWGYITASLATFFVGRDADNDDAEIAGRKTVELLRADIASLRSEIQMLRQSRE